MSSPQSDRSAAAEPNEEGIFQAEAADSKQPSRRGRLPKHVILLLFVAGVALSITLYWLPAERAKWRIAAAQAKWLEDDLSGAIQVLDAAALEFPENPGILEQRFTFYLEAKQFEKALADAERLKTLLPNSPTPLALQSQALFHLGRHDAAIQVCAEMLRLAEEEWIGSAAVARNFLAYAQAIGNTQLDEALEHINEALRLAGDDPGMLDTRGFIKYRQGDWKGARDDCERAVAGWEQRVAKQDAQRLLGVRIYQSESTRANDRQALAVLLYHRSLVYDRMGMEDEAKVDRERVRNLGYEPNEQLF